MKCEIIYPAPSRKKQWMVRTRRIVKWAFLFTAFICAVVNLSTGGKAWSAVVLWSLWLAWSLVFSPDLVEYNRISQLVKIVAGACVLLILIDVLLSPGWALSVVPDVCFGGIAVVGALLFTDFERQKQNVMPLLWMTVGALAAAGVLLWLRRGYIGWEVYMMGAFATALIVACAAALGFDMLRQLKKHFHTG